MSQVFSSPKDYAAERWAEVIVRVLDSASDPRSVDAWAVVAGTSGGALRTWCRTAHISTKRSLDFARLLRAIARSQGLHWDPHNILDIIDPRTLHRLFERAGLSGNKTGKVPPSSRAFVAGQRLVTNEAALGAIERLLEARQEPTAVARAYVPSQA